MGDLDLAFPFSLGLVAAFNPCGFAMLPTYLAYFVGLEDDSDDQTVAGNVVRGTIVGLVMTLGFVAVFGTFGFVTSHLLSQGTVAERLPYVTIAVGVLLVPLGIAMILGFEPNFRLPKLNKGTGDRQLTSVFVFGISYAVVSLSCTAPLFLAAVAGSFTDDGVVGGTLSYLAYAAGMGAVIVFLTIAIAMARGGVARRMRQFLPYVNRVAGGLLIVAGVYVTLYGWWEVRILRDPGGTSTNRVQKWIEDFQADINNWIRDVGAGRVGLLLLFAIVVVVGTTQAYRRSRPSPQS